MGIEDYIESIVSTKRQVRRQKRVPEQFVIDVLIERAGGDARHQYLISPQISPVPLVGSDGSQSY